MLILAICDAHWGLVLKSTYNGGSNRKVEKIFKGPVGMGEREILLGSEFINFSETRGNGEYSGIMISRIRQI